MKLFLCAVLLTKYISGMIILDTYDNPSVNPKFFVHVDEWLKQRGYPSFSEVYKTLGEDVYEYDTVLTSNTNSRVFLSYRYYRNNHGIRFMKQSEAIKVLQNVPDLTIADEVFKVTQATITVKELDPRDKILTKQDLANMPLHTRLTVYINLAPHIAQLISHKVIYEPLSSYLAILLKGGDPQKPRIANFGSLYLLDKKINSFTDAQKLEEFCRELRRDNFIELLQDVEKCYPFFLDRYTTHSSNELIIKVREAVSEASSTKPSLEEFIAKLESLREFAYESKSRSKEVSSPRSSPQRTPSPKSTSPSRSSRHRASAQVAGSPGSRRHSPKSPTLTSKESPKHARKDGS